MQKLFTTSIAFLLFGLSNFIIAQESDFSAVIKFKPIINKSPAPREVCEDIYKKIIKSLDTKKRFVAFAEGQDEPTDIAATILGEIKIIQYAATQQTITPKKPKDAPADWKNPGPSIKTESSIIGDVFFTNVSTGAKLPPSRFHGYYENSQKKTAIKSEGVAWSKSKGIHNTKKSKKDINQQKSEIVKQEAAWKRNVANKAIENAMKKWNDSVKKIMPVPVKIKSIAESKKNKAIRLMIDAGLDKDIDNAHSYDVVEISSYEVGGKKVDREKKLGMIWVYKRKYIMENESSFKVGKGKKKIFEAIQNNKELALILR